jgi:predicted Zn-dependent protease with MMP-like domain
MTSRKQKPQDGEFSWDELQVRAGKALEEIISSLPEDIRVEASKVPCLFEKWSEEEDLLGTYDGFEAGCVSEEGGRIILYLGNIFQLCQEEDLDFEKEVRRTYLHELGHHLGWDEDEVEKHGL